MTKKIILATSIAILSAFTLQNAFAQSLIDVGIGASTQDRYFTNLAHYSTCSAGHVELQIKVDL